MPSYGAESNLFAYLKAKSQGPGGMLFNRGILSLSSAALLLLLGVMLTGLDTEPFETIGIVCISFAVLMVILALRFFSASSERSREWTDRFVRAYFHPSHESVPHRVLGNLGDRDTPSPQEQPMRPLPIGMKPPPYDSVVAFGLFPPAECAYMFLQPPPTYDGSNPPVACPGTSAHPLGFLYTPEEPPAYQSAESLGHGNCRSSVNYLGQRSHGYLGHSSRSQPSSSSLSSVRMFRLRDQPVRSSSALNTVPIALLCHGQLVNAHYVANHINNNNHKQKHVNGSEQWTMNYPQSQRSLDALNTSLPVPTTTLPHSATLPVIPSTSDDFAGTTAGNRLDEHGAPSTRSEEQLPHCSVPEASLAQAHSARSDWVLLGGLVEELNEESFDKPSDNGHEARHNDSPMSLSPGIPQANSPTAEFDYSQEDDPSDVCAVRSSCCHANYDQLNGNEENQQETTKNSCGDDKDGDNDANDETLYAKGASKVHEENAAEFKQDISYKFDRGLRTCNMSYSDSALNGNEPIEPSAAKLPSEADITCHCTSSENDINPSCRSSENESRGS